MSGQVRATRADLVLIQQAAEKAMTLFSNQLGNFPIWTDDVGPSRMSTLWNDIGINRAHLENLKSSRTFQSLESKSQSNKNLNYDYGGLAPPLPQRPRADTGDAAKTGPVRYFLLDRRIIVGCCESPTPTSMTTPSSPTNSTQGSGYVDERGPFVVVTMRDASGRNSWKVRVSSLEQHRQGGGMTTSQSRRSLAS